MNIAIDLIAKPLVVFVITAAITVCTFLLPQPAYAQSDQWNALFDRIIRLEANVRAMSNTGAGSGGSVAGDASYRLTTMEAQLRQLLGEVQRLSRQMRQMQDQVQRMQSAGD